MIRRWVIGLLLLVAIPALMAFDRFRPHTVPLDECSDIYRRYAPVQGVDAYFVKDYPVNDTLSVDVTLLQATDTAAWRQLSDDFHFSNDFKATIAKLVDSDLEYLSVVTSKKYYTDTAASREFVGVVSPKKYICIFHYTDANTWDGFSIAIIKRVLFSLNTKEDIVNKQEVDNHPNTTNHAENI